MARCATIGWNGVMMIQDFGYYDELEYLYIRPEKEFASYKEPKKMKDQVSCKRQMNAPVAGRNY